MPIFEYQCESCGADVEKLVFPSEKEPVTCPKCNADSLKKKMSAATIGGGSSNAGCPSGPSTGFS